MSSWEDVFTGDAVRYLVEQSKTNAGVINNFQKLLEIRARVEEIVGIARNWDNVSESMKSTIASLTCGLYYADMYIMLMDYLSSKMDKK